MTSLPPCTSQEGLMIRIVRTETVTVRGSRRVEVRMKIVGARM